MGTFGRIFSVVFVICSQAVAAFADGGAGADDSLHFVNVIRAYDVMKPAYRPFSGSGLWVRPCCWRGDAELKGGGYADGSGKGIAAGCCITTAKVAFIPLAAAVDLYASHRSGGFERRNDVHTAIDGHASGIGGSISVRAIGLDVRTVAFYERTKSEERGKAENNILSDVFNVGLYLSQKILPLGPISVCPELAVVATRMSAADGEFFKTVGNDVFKFKRMWSSSSMWRLSPGAHIAFNGPGRGGCRISGRWNFDLGHRPTVKDLVPDGGADYREALEVTNSHPALKWPKSGYGELEMAFGFAFGKELFGEASVATHSINRRGMCAMFTLGKGF
ncbi:MAG: hypothetical protein LBI39_01220 [Puniceicoccales bacterium]|jgi:hypothetical protein|nr:hypothetical protein [Puniceicoccales bacterium]